MRIGMTYDLRDDYLAAGMSEEETAEFDKLDTIEAIEQVITAAGHETVRIGNVTSLVTQLAKNERWDLVFNIAEGVHGFGREAQVPALLDAYQVPYVFSGPLVQAMTLHKGIAKHVVRDSGLPTPAFAVINCPGDIAGVRLPYPLFAKPVAEGTGKGINATSKITDSKMLQTTCAELLTNFKQPVLVETFLPGREFTVGIVGNGEDARSLGVLEVVLLADSEPEVYSYHNKAFFANLVEYHAVDDAEAQKAVEVALACYRVLGCNDAGRVDLRSDGQGLPHFIEINSLAGLHPEISDLSILADKHGINYQQLIGSIIDAAIKRLGLQ